MPIRIPNRGTTITVRLPNWMVTGELKVIAELSPSGAETCVLGDGTDKIQIISLFIDVEGWDPNEDVIGLFDDNKDHMETIADMVNRRIVEILTSLQELNTQGVLTDAEFNAAKGRLLGQEPSE